MSKSVCAAIVAVFFVTLVCALSAQAPAYTPTMTFDVASIRVSHVDLERGVSVRGSFSPANSSHLILENNSFLNLLLWAYPAESHRVFGLDHLPSDLQRDFFMLEAKADEADDAKLAQLPKDQRLLEQQHMMQVLLAERFNLKVHWETRDTPTYDLVVAKSGKLQTTGAPPTSEEITGFGDRGIPPLYQKGSSMRGFEYIAHGASTADIAQMLTGQFGVTVNDKTGLAGHYYFDLKSYQTRMSDRSNDETNPWPPLETAISDQLGLKLVHSHGPVQYLVVDHAEMPSAN